MQPIEDDRTLEPVLPVEDSQASDAPKPSGDDDLQIHAQAPKSQGMFFGSPRSRPFPTSDPAAPPDDFATESSDQQTPEKSPLFTSPKPLLGRHSIRRNLHRTHGYHDDREIIRANLSKHHLKPVIKSLVYLLGGLALAIAHHLFNSWANDRPTGPPTKIPQVWIFRVGTALAFAFQTFLAASLSFVICQLLWFSTRRKYLTLQDIETLYLVERRDILATFMPNAAMHGPLLVGGTLISFLLPITAVFAPASLGVKTATLVESGPCTIASGDFKDISEYAIFSQKQGCVEFADITPRVARIAETAFISGTPTPLPEFCGKNCTYQITVDSMAYKCKEDVALPPGQLGTPAGSLGPWTFWNTTLDGDPVEPNLPIYVGWATGSFDILGDYNGTNSSAYCIPVHARYEFTVQTINDAQNFSYNVTTGEQLAPMMTKPDQNGCRSSGDLWRSGQIPSITYATRQILLGSLSVFVESAGEKPVWEYNTTASLGPFLNMTQPNTFEQSFTWGDVVKGIEETSAIITAALLNLAYRPSQSHTCSYIHSNVVYNYNLENLWEPYGTAMFVVTLSLVFGAFVLVRYNPDNLTTSFGDTVNITRNLEIDNFARRRNEQDELKLPPSSQKYRLGEMSGGSMGYGTEQDF